jgi:hypothetical protein
MRVPVEPGEAECCGATCVVFARAQLSRDPSSSAWVTGLGINPRRTIDGGHVVPTPEKIEENRQSAIDARCVQLFAPVLAALGTIFWAYGERGHNQPLA